jgi:hypothetical protein
MEHSQGMVIAREIKGSYRKDEYREIRINAGFFTSEDTGAAVKILREWGWIASQISSHVIRIG